MPAVLERPRAEEISELLPYLTPEEQAQLDELLTILPDPSTGPLAWAERFRRIDGQPFSLDRFPPLRALYEDTHPHIAAIKPAQRGISEWAVNLACFALEHGARAWADGHKDGLNVGYLFPTQTALGDFSKERLSGLREESEHLAALFGGEDDYDNVTFKKVGRSYLYLRGAWSRSALKSFAADVLVLDEFDEMEPTAVALARRRLNASVVRREVDISTPTLPGKGIHALYLQSDQRVYEQRCAGCGTWHTFDFFRDVRADAEPYDVWKTWAPERLRRADVRLTCPSCRRALTDDERCAPGRWAALAPDVRGLRGYQIPWWPFPFISLETFAVSAVSQDPSELAEFYRSDLGLPYEATGSRVTEAMLRQLSAELPGGRLPAVVWHSTTMGVDVGARFHYRVSSAGPDGAVYVRAMGSVGSWGELDRLMTEYGVRQCVIDALPELHASHAWAARHRGKVLRAIYPGPSALPGQLYRTAKSAEAEEQTKLRRRTSTAPANLPPDMVHINRTMAMDGVYAAVAGAKERWPAQLHNQPEVIAHMTAPVRVTTTDERGQEQASWVHTSPDHLFHACVYDHIARATLPKPGVFVAGSAARGWNP